MESMSRMKQVLWPVLTDDQSARILAQRTSNWVFAWSVLWLAIGTLDLIVILLTSGAQTRSGATVAQAFVWYAIAQGIVFGVIGWGIRKISLISSIIGLVISIVGALAILPSPFGFFFYLVLAVVLLNAVRATHRHQQTIRHTG